MSPVRENEFFSFGGNNGETFGQHCPRESSIWKGLGAHSSFVSPCRALLLNWQHMCPGPCLEIFGVVTLGEGVLWHHLAEARNAAQHPKCTGWVPPTRPTQAQVPTVVLARNPGLEQRHPRRLQILPQNQVGNRGSGTGSQGASPPCHLLAPGDSRRAHPSLTEQFQDGKPPPAPPVPKQGQTTPGPLGPQMAEGTTRSRRKDQKTHQVPIHGPGGGRGAVGAHYVGAKLEFNLVLLPPWGSEPFLRGPSLGCKERSPQRGREPHSRMGSGDTNANHHGQRFLKAHPAAR